jgi:hypothetical protein
VSDGEQQQQQDDGDRDNNPTLLPLSPLTLPQPSWQQSLFWCVGGSCQRLVAEDEDKGGGSGWGGVVCGGLVHYKTKLVIYVFESCACGWGQVLSHQKIRTVHLTPIGNQVPGYQEFLVL